MTLLEKALNKELDFICDENEYNLTEKQKNNIVDRFINNDYIGELIDNELVSMIKSELGE